MKQTGRRVAVCVLTHDRREETTRTIERLVALPERPRIVVVDDASAGGGSADLRQRFPGVDVVRAERAAGTAGRNLGVEAAPTPYVAFCDPDTSWAPGALATAADLLDAYPRLAVVTARVLVAPRGREEALCAVMARSPLGPAPGLPGHRALGLVAGACVVRRAAFLAVGGFEPRLADGAAEKLLAVDLAEAGWEMAYVPEVVARREPAPAAASEERRLAARNELWVSWLRRPARAALSSSLSVLGGLGDGERLRVALAALRGAAWVRRERRVVSQTTERALAALDLALRAPLPAPADAGERLRPAAAPLGASPSPVAAAGDGHAAEGPGELHLQQSAPAV